MRVSSCLVQEFIASKLNLLIWQLHAFAWYEEMPGLSLAVLKGDGHLSAQDLTPVLGDCTDVALPLYVSRTCT